MPEIKNQKEITEDQIKATITCMEHLAKNILSIATDERNSGLVPVYAGIGLGQAWAPTEKYPLIRLGSLTLPQQIFKFAYQDDLLTMMGQVKRAVIFVPKEMLLDEYTNIFEQKRLLANQQNDLIPAFLSAYQSVSKFADTPADVLIPSLSRSLGFIHLKNGKTAEIQLRIETDPMEWLIADKQEASSK